MDAGHLDRLGGMETPVAAAPSTSTASSSSAAAAAAAAKANLEQQQQLQMLLLQQSLLSNPALLMSAMAGGQMPSTSKQVSTSFHFLQYRNLFFPSGGSSDGSGTSGAITSIDVNIISIISNGRIK